MTDTTQSAESALREFRRVEVKNFDPLIEALSRADRKGYLPDAMADEWAAFDWREIATETAAPAWRSGYDTSEEAQAAYFENMKPGEEGASPKVYNQGGEGLQRPTALSDAEIESHWPTAFAMPAAYRAKILATVRAALAAERLRAAPPAEPETREEIGSLLCSIADNLGDMPVSEAWAERTSQRAVKLLEANDYFRPLPLPGGQQP